MDIVVGIVIKYHCGAKVGTEVQELKCGWRGATLRGVIFISTLNDPGGGIY